ncbi:MAG TPA: cytidylate kinase family protein [Thermoplasmata archaeon]|nr:cytidylate kinase family protein [Thermoplasmata archaeon]
MTGRVVALAGPPGSGKSTAGRSVAQTLSLEYVSAGAFFRAEAAERGLSLAELSRLAETEASVDRHLDARMLALATPGRLLDGRICGALCRQRGIPVAYVWVTASEAVRVARLAQRDGQAPEACRALTRAREASERRRYLAYYGIDLDAQQPDLTIDSTRESPAQVASAIVRYLSERAPP